MTTTTARLCLTVGATGLLWLQGLVFRAQGQQRSEPAAVDLKADARLKAPITTNFKKPKVRDLLDSLENATGLKFAANEMVE